MEKYLSKEKYEELKKELERLETEERHKVAEDLKKAAAYGDLTENAAFDDARDAQLFLDAKIAELKGMLQEVKIVEKSNTGKASIGSTVVVLMDDEEMTFELVGASEADLAKGKVSYESPIGSALMNRSKGEEFEVETPGGIVEYKIVDIK